MIARTLFALCAGFAAIGDNDDPATPIVWPSPNITVMIGAEGSDNIDDGSDLSAIRNALDIWSSPGCTNLRLIDGGTDATPSDGDDGVNTIYFRETDWPGGLSGAAAVTVHHENSGSPDTWRDADILLNGQDLEWSTTGEPQKFDVQSVVTHELGHLFGLKHAADPESSMYFVSPRGNTQRRTLSAKDLAAVCWLYPANNMRTCADDNGCPMMISPNNSHARLACSNGQCVPGRVGYGGECFDGNECNSGTCLDDPDTNAGDDPGFCTASCATDACINGDLCTSNQTCFLGRDDCVIDADCQQNNVVCALDLDGRRKCSHLCIRDANCADGEICHGGTGANPPGFCRTPGAGQDGAECNDGYGCASLNCAGSGTQTTCIGGEVVVTDAGAVEPDAAINPRDAAIEPPSDAAIIPLDGAVSIVDAGAADGGREVIEGSGCGCTETRSGSTTSVLFLFLFVFAQVARASSSTVISAGASKRTGGPQ